MKKIVSSFMAVVMTLIFSLGAFASSSVSLENSKTTNPTKKIKYLYYSAADSSAYCYYTNDYFKESSYIYNQSLATMTLSLAFSAFGSTDGEDKDYSNKSSNAKDLFLKLGFKDENIEANEDFKTKPTMDSIGVIAGNMPITLDDEAYTLVAVAVRGAGYEQEWASNFTLGLQGQHKGFSEGKEKVIDFLKSYFSSQNISGNVKIWITGYSRAAAVANLVAGAIDDGLILDDDIKYDLDDVFAYCFEAPAGAEIDALEGTSRYENIFNIINPNDIVPFVAPYDMGFGRYGVDIHIPTKESNPEDYDELKAKMLEYYYAMEGTTTYTVDDFHMKKLGMENWLPGGEKIEFIIDDEKNDYSQNVYLSNYVTILAKEFFKDRDTYVSTYEEEVREICSVMFGCSGPQQKLLMDSFVAQAQAEWGTLAWSYVWNAGINPWGDKVDALQIISNWLKKAIDDAGITDYNEEVVNSAGIALGDLMISLVLSHPNYFTTAVMNIDKLAEAHFPELCLAWMQSLDENYLNDAGKYLTPYDGNGVNVSDEVIYGMWDKLTFEDAKNLFEDAESITTNESGYVGTGAVFTYGDIDYTVVILGDIDGNGTVTSTDYVRIKSNLTGSYALDKVSKDAADIDNNENITATDYLRVKSHFLKSYNLYENKIA